MTAPRHPGPGHADGGSSPAAAEVARRMARSDRSGEPRRDQTRPSPAGATASADAVEALRRSITDIKHDVRMLKVMVDRQSIALERIAQAVEQAGSTEEE